MATKIKLIADNVITTSQIDTSSLDSHFTGGTGVTYSSGTISIGQAVHSTDSPTFADLTITGNLNITGDINSYNVTDLDVTDKTITLGAGQTEALSGGSGIIIDGSNASILWDETNDEWDFNKPLNVAGNIQTNGIYRAYDSVSTNYRNVLGYDSGNVKLQTGTGSSSYGISLFTAGTERLTINGSGNVGIGETSPITPLHVKMATGKNILFQDALSSAAIKFTTDAGAGYAAGTINGSSIVINGDSGGNVGVATGSSAYTPSQLTVMGNNTGYVASNGSGINGLHICRTTSLGENIYLYTTDGNAIGWSGIGNVGRIESYGNNAFEIGSQQNAPIIIGTNDTEKLRVQNSLNHNGNTHYSVQIQGGLAIANGGTISPNSTGAGQLTIESNGYHGYIAVDGTGMHIGNNSTGRITTLDVNETTVLRASYDNNGNRILINQSYGGAQWPSNPTGMSRPEYALGIINNNSSYSGNYVTMAFMTEPTSGNQGYAFIGAVDRGAENSDLVFGSRTGALTYSEFLRIANDGVVSAGSSTSHRGNNIINWTARNWIGLTGDLPGYSNTEYPVLKTPYDYMYISVNGSYSAYIAGNGSYTANSDERLKTNITTLPSGQLDKVANLRGVNFEWLDTNRGEGQQLGVIAQEIEAEYPELVTEGVEDIKGVNYAGLVVPLIEAIKELKTKLEAAEARITELEG